MTFCETIDAMIAAGYDFGEDCRFKFNIKKTDTPIMDLPLDNRTMNALLRHKKFTVGDALDWLNETDLKAKSNGLGAKSIKLLKNTIAEWYWSLLNLQEQAQFLEEALS